MPIKITEIETLSGVGKQTAKHLARLGVVSLQDLLFHLPFRYQDRTRVFPINRLLTGEHAVVEGCVTDVQIPRGGKTKLLCRLQDDTGHIQLRFFHMSPFQKKLLKPGVMLRCFSEVRFGQRGLEMFHPEFQVLVPEKKLPIDLHLTPVYPATEGLSQFALRKLMAQVLLKLEKQELLPELLPVAVLQSLSLPTLQEALQVVHRPPQALALPLAANNTPYQKRLVFEELLAYRLSLLHIKNIFQTQQTVSLPEVGKLSHTFLENLPFALTTAQTRVMNEIHQDLSRAQPMLRLLQGDVGSGKTVVAALAMLRAVENGYQAALMAPTELLAEQHYRVLAHWFAALNVQVVLLSGHVTGSARNEVFKKIQSGEAQVVVGTHALFQKEVCFARLALIVIDEQHRFGVQQRALLREKAIEKIYPHQLMMTATPIPRTLAMSFYADLDCSVIDELPPGRTPVVTSIISEERREEVIMRIREACRAGRQVYWVCPLIEESEKLSYQAATKIAEYLQQQLTDFTVGLVHGRLSPSQKEAVMRDFQQGKIHLLVATTVVEVGVDVPNASLMVIENAERLGLSQLHQLRGRVGRGSVASHCLLLYQSPLSELAKERLAVIRQSHDGFVIAERDLALRGPGEVLGTRQTGELNFRLADWLRDSDLLPAVRESAEIILRDYAEVVPALIQRWVGEGEQYGKV